MLLSTSSRALPPPLHLKDGDVDDVGGDSDDDGNDDAEWRHGASGRTIRRRNSDRMDSTVRACLPPKRLFFSGVDLLRREMLIDALRKTQELESKGDRRVRQGTSRE